MAKTFDLSQVLSGLDINSPSSTAALTLDTAKGGQAVVEGQEQGQSRWKMLLGDTSPEGGANTGSNFQLIAFSDTGALLSTPITINRQTGVATINSLKLTDQTHISIGGGVAGNVLATNGAGVLSWSTAGSVADAPSDGQYYSRRNLGWAVSPGGLTDAPLDGQVYGRKSATWTIVPPPPIATDAPSDGQAYARQSHGWVIVATSAPVYLPLTGGTLTGPLLLQSTSGAISSISGETGTTKRWELQLGNATLESGANAGSDFSLIAYKDDGTILSTPLTIQRSSGAMTFTGTATFNQAVSAPILSGNVSVGGNLSVSGSGTFIGALAAPSMTVPVLNGNLALNGNITSTGNMTSTGNASFNNGTFTGNVTAAKVTSLVPSDARIKRVLDTYKPGLNEVARLQPVAFAYIGNDSSSPGAVSPHYEDASQNKIHIGLVAQEVERAIPGMVSMHKGFIDGHEVYDLRKLNSHELIYALVNAVRELKQELDALKGR